MFVHIRGQESDAKSIINLSQVVRAEYEESTARSANVTLWYSNGESESWGGQIGKQVVDILKNASTQFVG